MMVYGRAHAILGVLKSLYPVMLCPDQTDVPSTSFDP